MKCGVSLQLILNVSLLFSTTNLFISEISGNDNDMVIGDDLMSSGDIKPISYDVMLTLDEAYQQVEYNIYFSGQCNIEIEINSRTDHITLHAQEQYVRVHDAVVSKLLPRIQLFVKKIVYDNKNHYVKIYVTQELLGRFLLKLYFHSFPSTEEVFKTYYANETGHGMLIAATHLRPTRTRALFPCWDNLQIIETFNITIKLKGKYTALSNMPKSLNACTTDTGVQILHFRASEMSTYDIGIAIFDHNLLSDHFSLKYRPNLTNHLEFAQTIINNVTQHLKINWESFLEFQKGFFAYHVAIPGFPHEGMMKKELNIFREEAILYNVSMDPFATKIEVARLVARVVVHEWLNSLIHPNLWSSLWLNEGIAMLLGQDIINQIYPDLRILDLFVVQFHQESLHLDIESPFPIMESVIPKVTIGTSINELFSFSHYIKAPVILYMLQRLLTSEVFWKGIRIYFNKPLTFDEEFKMTSLDDFCAAMQAALVRAPIPETQKFDVKKVMYTWMTQTQYSVVNVTRITHSAIEYFSQIKIEIENINELNQGEWYLPITITTQSKLNYNLTSDWQLRGNSWLKRDEAINFLMDSPLSYNKDKWEIINLQQIGYYRVKYDAENWQRLARYLNSDNYTNIHVLNRAQIIDDAFHFLIKGQINLTIFLDLTKYLSHETDYIAWYPVIKNLEYMSIYFPYEESTFIKEKFRVSMKNLLDKIGYEETFDNIGDCLKQETAKWACVLGCSDCKKYIKFYLRLHVSYNTRVLPWRRDWTYCKGLMIATYTTWKEIFDTFLNETDNKILKFLACSGHPIIIRDYMNLITNNKYTHALIKNKGQKTFVNIFHSIVERHAKNNIVLEYILNNFDLVIPSVIGTMVALTDIINHVYSIQHLDKIKEFLLFSRNIPDLHVVDKLQTRKHQIWKQKEDLLKFMER